MFKDYKMFYFLWEAICLVLFLMGSNLGMTIYLYKRNAIYLTFNFNVQVIELIKINLYKIR